MSYARDILLALGIVRSCSLIIVFMACCTALCIDETKAGMTVLVVVLYVVKIVVDIVLTIIYIANFFDEPTYAQCHANDYGYFVASRVFAILSIVALCIVGIVLVVVIIMCFGVLLNYIFSFIMSREKPAAHDIEAPKPDAGKPMSETVM